MPHRELVNIGLYSKWCSWRQSLEFNYQENNYCPSMTTRNHLTLCDSMGSPCLKHRCRLGNRCLSLTAHVHWLCLSTTIINTFLNRSSQMVSSLCVCPPKKAIVLLLPLERCFSQPWMGTSATPGNVTELWTEAHSVPVLYIFFESPQLRHQKNHWLASMRQLWHRNVPRDSINIRLEYLDMSPRRGDGFTPFELIHGLFMWETLEACLALHLQTFCLAAISMALMPWKPVRGLPQSLPRGLPLPYKLFALGKSMLPLLAMLEHAFSINRNTAFSHRPVPTKGRCTVTFSESSLMVPTGKEFVTFSTAFRNFIRRRDNSITHAQINR